MYVNDTGFASVTEILRPFIDDRWFSDEAAERGSAIHSAAAAFLQGLFVPPLKPEWRGYFESFKKWSDIIDEVVLIEERLTDTAIGFTGQADMIIRIKGDEGYSLPDIKTGQSKLDIWMVQSAAYRHLAKTVKGIDTIRGFPVRPKPDGSGVLPVGDYARNYAKDFNDFVSALNCHKRFCKNKKEVANHG
uniref:PD-(D/E)XK nuclease superfamily protein n=1 Tax=viral metagenome TaxID=1070528 RepID=A0A6H1ZP56_9ZZZZ